MDKNTNNKAWYKKWWVWVIAVVVLLGIAGAATPEDTENKTANQQESATTKTEEPKEWVKVSELTGSTREANGEVMELTTGAARVKYTVNAASDTGTAFIYLLPEGWTPTKNAQGEMNISAQDITTFGSKSGEEVLKKPAGKYYVYVNTSSIIDYTVTVEEQK